MLKKSLDTGNKFNGFLRTNRLLSERIRNYLPIVLLTNSSALLFPLVDTLIVGNMIGGDALAAVSMTMPIFMLCSILTRILSSGLSKTISIYLGKNDNEGINRCFQANRMILIIGFIATLLIQLPVAYLVIGSYSLNGDSFPMVWAYFISSMVGAPFDFVKSICVYNLRAFGKMKNLASLTILVQIINLVGDIVLIRFLNLGIYGAGMATSISQIVFGVTSFVLVCKHTDMNKFTRTPWLGEMKTILKTGFPRGLRVGLNAAQSWILSVVVLYTLDTGGMAAKAACTSCYNILTILSMSINEITQPLAGILHGAGDKVGSRNLLRMSLTASMSVTLFLQLLIEIFPGTVLGWYGIKAPTPDQISILRIFCSFIFLSAGINLITDYFSSVQKSGTASVLTTLNGAPVFTPILLLLSFTVGGVYVWYAYLITALIAAAAAVYFLKKYVSRELSSSEVQKEELYLSLHPKDGVRVSELVVQHFSDEGYHLKTANRMGIFLEELTMYIRENNPRARIDVIIKENEQDFVILLFDNGRHRDYRFELEHTELYDRLRIARLVCSNVFYRNVLELNYVSASFEKAMPA